MRAKDTLNYLIHLPNTISIMLKANHGMGKSDLVKQAAEIIGGSCIDIRLSQKEVGDIVGMPFHVQGRTYYAPPEWFPMREEDKDKLKELLNLTENISLGNFGEKGILFLDELNRANIEVQQAAFELVLDRRLNCKSLPDGWRVVTAINDNTAVYRVQNMEAALLSRFYEIPFEPSQEEWFEWLKSNGKHHAVIEFCQKYPDMIDPNDDMLAENEGKKLFDRRSWTRLADSLTEFETKYQAGQFPYEPLAKENAGQILIFAAGFIGMTASAKFAQFIETEYKSLDADTILNKWDKTVKEQIKSLVDDPARLPEVAHYSDSLVEYIQSNIKDELDNDQTNNLRKFLEMMPKELVASFWKEWELKCKSVCHKWYNHEKYAEKHEKIILDALSKPENVE